MKKILITKLQDQAVQAYLHEYNSRDAVQAFVDNNDVVLKDFTPAQFALLLCGWYEVEPEFKVGDWVGFDDLTEGVGKIVRIVNARRIEAEITGYSVPQSFPINRIRHATPEEIQQEKESRWWAKHGREVWQIKSGDVLFYECDKTISVVNHFKNGFVYFDNEYDGINEIKNYYKVICFVENRLDIGESNES